MHQFYFFIYLICLLSGCSGDHGAKEQKSISYDWENHTPFTTGYQTVGLHISDHYNPVPLEKGKVDMPEASGLAYSVKNENMIWSHNDSGNPNTIYLIDTTNGEIAARYTITGTSNIDWEDMEIAIDPVTNDSYLYIGDIGDNRELRMNYIIYKFKEPEFKEEHRGQHIQLNPEDFSHIMIQYPDGSHDAESLLVDPKTNDIYLVTKRDVLSLLYVLPFPYKTGYNTNTLYKAGTFSFTQASAGTVSLDGTRIAIKNRQEIFYWEHQTDKSLWETLSQTPEKLPYIGEPQGESIAFDIYNNYFTLSEAWNNQTLPVLYQYLYPR